MKNILLLLLISTLFIFSCGKTGDKPANQLPGKAETKPQFDNTSFGVYKGVIIGSSGLIIFRINNGDNVAKGYLTIDGKKDTLSTNQTLTAGQPIVNVLFTGTFSSMILNADNDGQSARISDIQIDGHPGNVTGIVFHEKSTQQVFCYEGTLTGSRKGTFNGLKVAPERGDTTDGYLSVIARFDKDTLYVGSGVLYNNKIDANLYNYPEFRYADFTIKGQVDKDQFNGTWDFKEVYGTGSFTSVRTY